MLVTFRNNQWQNPVKVSHPLSSSGDKKVDKLKKQIVQLFKRSRPVMLC